MRAWAPSRDLRAGSLRVTAPGSAPTLTDGVVALDAHTLDDLDAHLAGEGEEQARRLGWYPASSTRNGQSHDSALAGGVAQWRKTDRY